MAKKRGRKAGTQARVMKTRHDMLVAGTSGSEGSNGRLESFAEDLGRLLGTAENKARGWLDQRKAIVTQLSQLRDRTNELLRELTGGAADMAVAVGVGLSRLRAAA